MIYLNSDRKGSVDVNFAGEKNQRLPRWGYRSGYVGLPYGRESESRILRVGV